MLLTESQLPIEIVPYDSNEALLNIYSMWMSLFFLRECVIRTMCTANFFSSSHISRLLLRTVFSIDEGTNTWCTDEGWYDMNCVRQTVHEIIQMFIPLIYMCFFMLTKEVIESYITAASKLSGGRYGSSHARVYVPIFPSTFFSSSRFPLTFPMFWAFYAFFFSFIPNLLDWCSS